MTPWRVILALALLTGSAAAQDKNVQPIPSFAAGVELVRLDVRVTDAQGRAVRDLRQDEVEVVEDGELRPVVFFQHIEEPTDSYAEVARRTAAGEVSTNQGAARGHLYVIIFDQQHIAPGNEQRARQAAQRFVQTRMKPGDRVALYGLPGPGPQIPFTADMRRINAELTKVRGLAEAQAVGSFGTMTEFEAFQIERGNDTVLQRVTMRSQAQAAPTDVPRRNDPNAVSTSIAPTMLVKEDARRIANVAEGQTRRVLAMLSDVLLPLQSIEGRKSVLLVSEGFYGDRLGRDIENVAAAAAGSFSVVYAIDVNRHELDIAADEPTGGDQATDIHDKLNPLGSLAAETGGMLLLDASRHADDVFATLADQSQDYYLIGFSPRTAALKDRGSYRRVGVRVHRSGTQVSSRTGFALGDAAARMDRHQSIERAMSAPFPQQGLPLQYTTYVLRGGAPGLQRVIVSLAAELPLAAANHLQPADVVFVVRSISDGRLAASGRDTIPLPTNRPDKATVGTGAYHVQFELPAGEYLMRAVVREPGGLIGSADRRFTVRALDGPSLASGDLVLSAARGDLPVRPVAYTGDGLSGVMELYGRSADQLRDARVTVDLIPIGAATASTSTVVDLQDVRETTTGAAREARVALPLENVTPGPYLARARVTVGPDTVTDVVREVDIRPGRRPHVDDVVAEFDPRDVVQGTFARQFAQHLRTGGSAGAESALLGLEKLGARDYPGAIAAFQAALAADASSGGAAFLLGWAFHGAGDDRQAISSWRRAAYTDPAIIPAHLALADIYVRLAQPALAIQALRAGLAAVPDAPELRDQLARLERK
jgi:VWFA-related protein